MQVSGLMRVQLKLPIVSCYAFAGLFVSRADKKALKFHLIYICKVKAFHLEVPCLEFWNWYLQIVNDNVQCAY